MINPAHERLDVYGKSLDAVKDLLLVSRALPHDWDDLRDQLRRAATSIPLNIAEGASEFSPAEKAKFYRYARRSSSECMAILDVVQLSVMVIPAANDVRARLDSVNAMLTKLIRAQTDRAG